MMLSKCVSCPSLCVFAEVVGGELRGLSEEGSELWQEANRVSHDLKMQSLAFWWEGAHQ